MIECEVCGRRFGGVFGYDRHLDRRRDRCRTNRELKARGLRRDAEGVWRRPNPTGQTAVLPGLAASRGHTAARTGGVVPDPHPPVRVPPSVTPQGAQGGGASA